MELQEILKQLLIERNVSENDLIIFQNIIYNCATKLNLTLSAPSDLLKFENLLQVTTIVLKYRNENKMELDFDTVTSEICKRFSSYENDDLGIQYLSDCNMQYRLLLLSCAMNYFGKINKPLSKKDPSFSLLNDMFQTTFDKISTYTKMMELDLYLDGYVCWRTIHESEATLTLLVNNSIETRNAYVRHIEYSNMFYNPQLFSDDYRNNIFDNEIKYDMSKHDLKSKDMKKYLEYGWLYSTSEYDMEKHPKFKLNFNDGVDELCGLREEYNDFYRGTSELAHSSSIYFYANLSSTKDLSLLLVYQSTVRILNLYIKFMKDYFNKNKSINEKANEIIAELDQISLQLKKDFDSKNE